MGRNIKEGLSFFPMDVDFFDDDKLMFVTARFGVKGDGIVTRLLCRIYRSGYFLKYDQDFALLFARSVGDTSLHGLVNDVVHELLKRGFFDDALFKRFGILTSTGIQKRYAKICTDAKRKGWSIVPEFDLLRNISAFTPEEIPKTPEEIPERKEKKSKGKNEGGEGAPPSPPKPGIDAYQSLEKNKSIALADGAPNGFLETYARVALPSDLLGRWLDAFHRQLSHDGDTLKQQKDYRQHFARWLKFQPYRDGKPEDFSPVKAPVRKSNNASDINNSLKTGLKHL